MRQENIQNIYLSVIVVAAGSGARMQSAEHKQFLKLCGSPMLAVTLQIFENHPSVDEIILVSQEKELERVRAEIIEPFEFRKVMRLVSGGTCRKDSVMAGLSAVSAKSGFIAIHDGARPLLTPEMFDRVLIKAVEKGGAILAVPVIDTLKRTDARGLIGETISRDWLWAAQTPQIFCAEWLYDAYERLPDSAVVTDDASVVSMAGYPVHLATGSWENLKVTVPDDLRWAEMILEGRREPYENWNRF
ncbi:MAG: 2-C-methyl-D-erythritol 4-phosphate cytidylyltransferase [Bacillota bacterium]|nr:2-C-methyl-D-erythritol 4-phosphate cytidylyltransferase [Bacillota bacterium]MDW7677137.1 2-C-methyl-D-erythritol 4-phosphate cytidylyltransferase [Bacillota bacterium]